MQTQSQNLESAFDAIKGASVQQQERVIAFINSLMNEKTDKQVGNFDKFAGILTAKKHVTIDEMNHSISRKSLVQTDNENPTTAELLSIVDEIAGCISVPDDLDLKAEKLARLEKKYLENDPIR